MKTYKMSTAILSMALFLFGNSMQAKAEAYVIPEDYNGYVPVNHEIEKVYTEDEISVLRSSLPASYDARKYGQVSAVDNQNPYGTCWSFATIAALEGSVLSQGLFSTIDLSEYHLITDCYQSVEDPLGGTAGDSVTYLYTMDAFLEAGGNVMVAYHALTNWMGAAEDTGYVEDSTYVMERTAETAYLNDVVHLQQFYMLNAEDMEAVKEAIMEYGAVTASMYYSGRYLGDDGAYYNDSYSYSNHAITLVGWDDNYSKSNFAITPSSDGAWLVKNSWGVGFGDEGYLWVSYEDLSLQSTMCILVGETADNYDNNYQYDGSYWNYYISGNTTGSAANVFQVPENAGEEILKAVAFEIGNSNTDYSIQIYKNPTNVSDPTSGTALLSVPVTGTAKYEGYHTVKLNEEIYLEPGDKFSVVVSFTNGDGVYIVMEDSTTWNNMVMVASAESEQSYISLWDSWFDAGESMGVNVRIKAFTVSADVEISLVEKVSVSPETADMYVGRTKQLTASITPDDANNKKIQWSSSDTQVATVDQNGLVTAVGPGVATITAMACDGSDVSGSSVLKVTLEEGNPFYDVYSDKWYYPYIKKAYENSLMTGTDVHEPTGLIVFEPETHMSRAMFVQVLYSMAGKPEVSYTDRFSDIPDPAVDKNAWYSYAVLWAAENGITAGVGDGSFGKDDLISREQMALMLMQYAAALGGDVSGRADLTACLDDEDVSEWATDAMAWALDAGVMTGAGTSEGIMLKPGENATRAEGATMLNAFYEKYCSEN